MAESRPVEEFEGDKRPSQGADSMGKVFLCYE